MTDTRPPLPSDLERQWQRELRCREENLDPDIIERLAWARQRALETPGRPRWQRRWLLPASGMAFASALSLWVVLPSWLPTAIWPSPSENVSMDSTAAAEDLYENLEFYRWLAANPREIHRQAR